MTISFARHQFPPVIIRHAVWLYVRFTLRSRRRRSARGARSGCLLRNGAAMGIEIRADVRPRTSPRTPDLFGVGFRCRASAPPRHKRPICRSSSFGGRSRIRSAGTVNLSDQGRERPSCARPYAGVAGSRHMFIALYGARPEIMHEVQRPLTMPVHPERIEFESPQLHQEVGGNDRGCPGPECLHPRRQTKVL
jgi:hypothetical protein